jgi:hypothetical protein
MSTVFGRGAALASCALVLGWSAALANGSGAQASDPLATVSGLPTSSTSYGTVPAEFSLTVSPTRLVLGPADTGTASRILVVNRGRSPVSVTVQRRNFTGGTDGALVFRDDAPYAAAGWVTVAPTSFQVLPGGTRVVTAAVAVPAGAEPGDHQVALVFLVPAGRTSGNVKVNRGVATPIYIAVPGASSDAASLSNLAASGFALGGPVTVSATVRDTGTVHRDFRGPTRLALSAAGDPVTFPDFTVLRGSTRDIATTWNPPLMCICHPSVSLVAADGSVQTLRVRVIVFPLHLLGIALGVLLVLVLCLLWWRRRHHAVTPAVVAVPVGPRHA